MYCKNCGKEISNDAVTCPSCGEPMKKAENPLPEIDSHMTGAILVTLFCCMPFGIISILKASKVSGFVVAGNYEQAYKYAKEADKWIKISLFCGIICYIFYVILIVSNM